VRYAPDWEEGDVSEDIAPPPRQAQHAAHFTLQGAEAWRHRLEMGEHHDLERQPMVDLKAHSFGQVADETLVRPEHSRALDAPTAWEGALNGG